MYRIATCGTELSGELRRWSVRRSYARCCRAFRIGPGKDADDRQGDSKYRQLAILRIFEVYDPSQVVIQLVGVER
jgi:hypothetical protein